MRRSANFVPVVVATFLLATLCTLVMAVLFSYLLGNSPSLKFLYTVAVESFENYHYECKLACPMIVD